MDRSSMSAGQIGTFNMGILHRSNVLHFRTNMIPNQRDHANPSATGCVANISREKSSPGEAA